MTWGILVLLLGLSVAAAGDKGQGKPATPAEQFRTLLKERQDVPEDLSKGKTDEERKKVLARLGKLPLRFLELAEQHPNDPVAVEALIQTVALANSSAFPAGGKDSPGSRALAILQRDHVHSDKLGPVCQQVVFGFHQSHETFLRAVLEKNPDQEVQGLACLSLAQFLNDRLHRLDVLKDRDRPDLAERYHRVFGKDFVEELQRQERAKVAREAETLFARAAEQYPDVKIPVTYFGSGGAVGEKAKAELFQIRHLAVGKVVPDIEGEDQDGKPFKLSELPRQGRSPRLLVSPVTDLTSPVAPRAVARQEPGRQAIRPDRGASQLRRRGCQESQGSDGSGEVELAVIRGPRRDRREVEARGNSDLLHHRPIRYVEDGKETGPGVLAQMQLVIQGDQSAFFKGAGPPTRGTYRLTPDKNPRQLDLLGTGLDRGKTRLGMYEFKDDTLTICVTPLGKARPEAFESKAGTGHVLEVWKQKK